MQAAIREALISAVNADYVAAYPTVPIVYDNAPFDRNKPPPLWVEFEVKFVDGNQIGMAWAPKTRTHGFVYVTIYAKEGTGSKAALLMLDWFSTKLGYHSVGGVNLQAPSPVGDGSPKGWYTEQMKLYWWHDPS
jgi:hypothetical protein